MKIAYYPETDSMYIDFSLKASVESKEISPGVVLDYDSEGNLLSDTDGNGNTTTYEYNDLNRLVRKTDPMGGTTEYKYDDAGNLIETKDRLGNITTRTYDAANRFIGITDALNNTTQYEYDGVGNLTRITDANGNATEYAYDEENRRIRETYADGGIISYTYDNFGNMTSRTDQKGQTTNYYYNDLKLLVHREYPSGTGDFFNYDPFGRMLRAVRGTWLVTYEYDGANRLTKTKQDNQTISYEYDTNAGTRKITYPGGRVITEQMDLRDRIVDINDSSSPIPIVEYTYDSADLITNRTYRNGITANYNYNANDRTTELEHKLGATLIAGYRYDYDAEGNRKYEDKIHASNRSQAYEYDNIYKLIDFKVGELTGPTVPVPSTQTQYTLDPVGNWDSKVTDGFTENRTHNSVNEITSIDGLTIKHDNNGNLEEDERFTYAYDEENRLISITRKSDGQLVAGYQYDALSRRVVKLDYTSGSVIETRYFYDDARIIEEQDAASFTVATYVYGNYVDEVLTMDRGGETYYYHQKSPWSIAAVTDSSATVIERYAYDTYGYVTVMDGTYNSIPLNAWFTPHSDIGNPYLFTGRRLDEETGLYHYRNRYYDPVFGRFISRDPEGYKDGMNLYEYVKSNPITGLDPYGKGWRSWLKKKWNQYKIQICKATCKALFSGCVSFVIPAICGATVLVPAAAPWCVGIVAVGCVSAWAGCQYSCDRTFHVKWDFKF